MKLSFLIQLILLLLLSISIFMVFTNSVTGRAKLIVIVFCVVVGLYLYSKMNIFKSYNEYYPTPESAKLANTISQNELKPSDGQFTLSSWVFIDDWNYRYGEEKVIMTKTMANSPQGTMHLPQIRLDKYKNDLIVDVSTYGTDEKEILFREELKQLLKDKSDLYEEDNINANVECSGGIIYYDSSNTNVACDSREFHEVIVENINMQKWVNIIVTVSNRSIDIYINGKLVRTKTFTNVIDTNALNYGDIRITPDGGFGGYISKVRYYPYYISPQKAWNIYKEGFGDAFESALNKYNMSVSFYQDSIEQNKFYLF